MTVTASLGDLDDVPGGSAVRVKLYVHGGTISFMMKWSGTLPELQDQFVRNLAPKRAGLIIEAEDRLTHVTFGAVSAYEFSRENTTVGTALAQIRPA